MGFPILVRWHLYIESGPRWPWSERLPDRPWQGQPWLPRTRLILQPPNPPVWCQVVDQPSEHSQVLENTCVQCNQGQGPVFIKPDQFDPWIKDQLKITPVYKFAPTVLSTDVGSRQFHWLTHWGSPQWFLVVFVFLISRFRKLCYQNIWFQCFNIFRTFTSPHNLKYLACLVQRSNNEPSIVGSSFHRPHSRQVTGARCTGGRGSPVMSWIFLKANNGPLDPGVGDKRFFHFKRNALYF